MNILSKSFIFGALAIVMTAAAFTASTSVSAEAGPRAHFRHAIHYCHNKSSHPYRCFNRVYNRVYNRALVNGYGPGYVSAPPIVNACGWKVIIRKHWNPAHTRLTIVKNKVWTCY
ncbi:MAG: hypothetical protein ABI705_01645 [Aestuariivirga sp.]